MSPQARCTAAAAKGSILGNKPVFLLCGVVASVAGVPLVTMWALMHELKADAHRNTAELKADIKEVKAELKAAIQKVGADVQAALSALNATKNVHV